MTLISMKRLLETAKKNNFAVGYFEAWDTYSLEAVAIAAEKEQSPIVLGFGGFTVNKKWMDNFGIEPLAAYANQLAKSINVPAAVYLNEVTDFEYVKRGIKSGFNSVLLDSSHLAIADNILITKKVVEFAHSNNANVQGEVGTLPNFFEDSNLSRLTNPKLAKEFVEKTNVDFLGVSIGNVHLHTKGKYTPNIKLLSKIHKEIKIPLVIHGTTGFPNNQISDAIQNGVSMFQVGTVIKKIFYSEIKKYVSNSDTINNIHEYVGSRKQTDFLEVGKNKIIKLISFYLRLFNSQNKKELYD